MARQETRPTTLRKTKMVEREHLTLTKRAKEYLALCRRSVREHGMCHGHHSSRKSWSDDIIIQAALERLNLELLAQQGLLDPKVNPLGKGWTMRVQYGIFTKRTGAKQLALAHPLEALEEGDKKQVKKHLGRKDAKNPPRA